MNYILPAAPPILSASHLLSTHKHQNAASHGIYKALQKKICTKYLPTG